MGRKVFQYPSRAAWFSSAALILFCACAQAQAPIIDASQPASSRARNVAQPQGGLAAASSSAELYQQLQSLQQEVMELRGLVEEQGHQIQTLRQQGLDRYNDLDRRIGGGAAVAPAAAGAIAAEGNAIDASAAPVAPTDAVPAGSEPKPDEFEAYKQAFAKIKAQDFSGGIKSFNAFLTDYPNSTLAANAYYWLGELYLQTPQDLNGAEQAFNKVVQVYPQHNKAPDALYKLGRVYFLKGDKTKSKQVLQQVIDEYGSSGSSAPQLAKQFLDQNFRK